MKTASWYVSRRAVLRGTGVGIALPFMDVMDPGKRTWAAANPTQQPRRFIGIFMFPCGYAGHGDDAQNAVVPPWTPAAPTGPSSSAPLETNPFLQPFFDKKVNSKLTVCTGLFDRMASHNYGFASMLSPRGTNCGDLVNGCSTRIDFKGPSADQIAAAQLQQYTAIPSLVIASKPPDYPTDHISWKTGTEPSPMTWNPRDIFNNLFGAGFDPTENKVAAAIRAVYRKSVLDFVKDSASRLKARLGRGDQQKLNLYLDSIRDLEIQIERSGAPASCNSDIGSIPDPKADPEYFSYQKNQDKRIPVLTTLIAKAMECDRTRVVAFTYCSQYGGHYPHIGPGPVHEWSHYSQGTSAEDKVERRRLMDKSVQWALSTYADLMWKLDQIRDPDGSTALDNSVITTSGDCADGDRHTNTSMPVLLGGRGGRTPSGGWGVNAGRHVRFARQPWQYQAWASGSITGGSEPSFTQSPGEQSVRDLLWGILKTIGISGLTTFGAAGAPIDLANL